MALAFGTSDLYSFFRSKNTSGLASGLLASEYSTQSCSPTKKRSEPGACAIKSGWLNFALGNTRADLYFGGGSGLPVTFEVVHGCRFPGTGSAFAFGGSFLSSAA